MSASNMYGSILKVTSRHVRKVHAARYDQVTRESSPQVLHGKGHLGAVERVKKREKSCSQVFEI
jgi:hypothetical protein